MTHTEFKLIANRDIMEVYSTEKAVHYRKGESITVSEDTFNRLQGGETIKIYTAWGTCEYSKYDFTNEVAYTSVTIDTGIRKLGQSKKKLSALNIL